MKFKIIIKDLIILKDYTIIIGKVNKKGFLGVLTDGNIKINIKGVDIFSRNIENYGLLTFDKIDKEQVIGKTFYEYF